MIKERNISMTKPLVSTKNSQRGIPYHFFYWGPLLFRTKLSKEDLKKCANLCSKKSSVLSDTLAGVIKHQHYVSAIKYCDILLPYFQPFRRSFKEWYGKPLTKDLNMVTAWVNFMKAGEFNPPHVHSGCDFSSVLFIQIPEKLVEEHKKFSGTAAGPGGLTFQYGEAQLYSICRKDFFPEEGDLFLFPATLSHFVAPFKSQGERISMSANFRLE